MLALGRPDRPPRPWLGVSAVSEEGKVILIGVARNGPAARAGLRKGDLVLAVGEQPVTDEAEFFRALWALGEAGVDVPLVLERDDDRFEVNVTSGDRQRFLKAAPLH